MQRMYSPIGDNIMLVYHVSMKYDEPRKKLFKPRIPLTVAGSEETETPRVCVSTSCIRCFTAIGYSSYFKIGVRVKVYSANISDEWLVPPEVLVNKYGVLDALYTHEHWCLKPIVMYGNDYVVNTFERDNYLLPDMVKEQAVREYLTDRFGDVSSITLHDLLNGFIQSKGIDEEDFAEQFGIQGIRVFSKMTLKAV